jgi:hypothetical protein
VMALTKPISLLAFCGPISRFRDVYRAIRKHS